MLGKATQLEPNITGFLRDFKRARYQKLAFVEYLGAGKPPSPLDKNKS